jgi:hypothetical protein
VNEKSTRFLIIILTLFTAFVHLVMLGFAPGHPPDVLFILNGLGYLGLLAAVIFRIPAGQQVLIHYAFMAYTLATIVAFFAIAPEKGALGYTTKAVEALLIVFLWLNLKRVQGKA